MQLLGIHHITAITADAPANLSFYSDLLGLRFIKKTVNFDDPTAYHLYYGDEVGHPGSILTFFEYPGAGRGSAGPGMIHRIAWRVADEEALDFWEERLRQNYVPLERSPGALRFRDPEGLELELAASRTQEQALTAAAADIPPRHAIRGFDGVRAFTSDPRRSAGPLEDTLGFAEAPGPATGDNTWRVAGSERSSFYAYDPAPRAQPVQGAGTVHHIAWAVPDQDQPAWRERLLGAGLQPADHRPHLLPLGVLPRAERRVVRDRHAGTGVRGRRADGAFGRDAAAAGALRVPAAATRAGAHAARPTSFAGGGMSDERLLSVVRRRPATPAGALVLLHGRGTDETDLAPAR